MSTCECCDPVTGGAPPTPGVATCANVGGGAEWYVTGTSGPFEFRTVTSPLGTISIVVNGDEIELEAIASGGATEFQSATVNFLNSATAYATAWTSAATSVANGETWVFICQWLHSNYSTSAVSSVRNRWQIEGPAGIWTTLEDNLCQNEGQSLNMGDVGSPRSRAYRITAIMNNPRLRLQASMNLFVGGSGNTQNPRIFGIRV